MSWADQMDTHCETFRELWREHGYDFLWQWSLNDFTDTAPDDLAAEWQRIDKELVELFQEFAAGRPAEARQAVDDLAKAGDFISKDLHKDLDSLGNVYLEDWTGDAADNFRVYLNDMKDALLRLQDCVASSGKALEAFRDMHRAYREDISTFVEQAQTGVEVAEAKERQEDEKVALNIVATVVAVGAVAVSGGAAAAVMAGVGSALVAGGTSNRILTMGGEHPGEVIYKMPEEGRKIVNEAAEATGRIERAFFSVTEYVSNVRGNKLAEARPDRPKIITDDRFDPNRFRHDDQPKRVTDKVDRGDLVEEPSHRDRDRDHAIIDPENPERNQDPDRPGIDMPFGPDIRPPQPTERDLYPEQ